MMEQQQNDHCIIRFEGEEWMIEAMHGLGAILLSHKLHRDEVRILDLSHADMHAYVETASAALNDEWWWLDLEDMTSEVIDALALPVGCNGTIFSTLRDAYRMGRQRIDYAELKRRQEAERKEWLTSPVYL